MAAEHPPRVWQEEIARGFVGFAFAAAVFTGVGGERGARLSGGLLLLLGGYAVLCGFLELRTDFGLPPAWTEIATELRSTVAHIREDVRRWLGRPPRQITATANAAGSSWTTGNARVTVGFNKSLPLDARVAALELRFERLSANMQDADDRLAIKIEALETDLAVEKQVRESARQSVLDRMQAVMTGGLRFQLVGVAWLLAGTVLSTLAPDLGPYVR